MTLFRKTNNRKTYLFRLAYLLFAFCLLVPQFGCTVTKKQDLATDTAEVSSSIAETVSADGIETPSSEADTAASANSASVPPTDKDPNPQIADNSYTYLIQNAPALTKNGVTSYDFSAVAWKYMTDIATQFPNRNVSFGLRLGGFPPELAAIRTHDEAARYIFTELTAHGYRDISNQASHDGDTVTNSTAANSASSSTEAAATVYTLSNLMDATLPLKDVCNITARLKGTDSSKQIIVGAHYDGDGAGDNGSGTALLLAVACGLKEHGVIPPVDLVFIFFDAEEVGFFGSREYTDNMTAEEIASTLFMVNMDSIAFGDYCYIYGGRLDDSGTGNKNVVGLDAYNHATEIAKLFDIKTCLTPELDGYFAAHGSGPALDDNTLFTNPWTDENPPPKNYLYPSPMTGPWSDHEAFSREGIDIIYFEASNMFAVGDGRYDCYTGYYETYDNTIGYYGMFMNTEYDTLENLETYFPGRARKHLSLFSRLLTALLQSTF